VGERDFRQHVDGLVKAIPSHRLPAQSRIATSRLALVSMTPDFLRASLRRQRREAGRLLALTVPTCWPDVDDAVLELRLRQLEQDPSLEPWLLRAIRLRRSGEMIGHIGFHGAPGARHLIEWCPGGVEIGYA